MLVGFRPLTICLAAALAAVPAAASDVHLRYEAYWGGLHAADFALSMADLSGRPDVTVKNEFRLRTRGVLDWIARLNLTARSTGTVAEAPPFLTPTGYSVDYTSRNRDRIVEVDFTHPRARTRITDRKDGGKVRNGTGKGDDFAEADLKPEHLKDVIDPLLGLTEALRRVRYHLVGGGPSTFTLRGFDGSRRFDMDGEVLGPASRVITEKKHETYRLRLTARPVAGFKKRHRVLWNDSAFDLYLSRDGRFVPLQIVSLGHGPVLTLVEECPAACALKEKAN